MNRAARIMPDGIFDESVVADQPELAVFDVGYAVEGVHQETVGAVVEREGHGVGGKVAPPEVFENGRRLDRRFAGLGIGDRQSAANLHRAHHRETAQRATVRLRALR